ncbi:dTDP-4-dehydrorhamnose reductase [Bradyrhizobium liaoningense]|uniref:dTDP-4-dehydrorhamnose reductase n=1 Tax=Bradyrhizobium liaoningense TaxID=43992 RepID=UPI000551F05A|nr:dTDP-4-dehydrorhamnose reductase [Bradyrhizobium liaoningense]
MTALRILLLGKDGQVGSALRASLALRGQLFAHNRTTCDLANIALLRNVIRAAKPNIIVNAAAYTAVDKAEQDEEACFKINAIAPGVIAEEATMLGAWLIHYSTDYVFDGAKDMPYLEDDLPRPLNVYGRSKLAGDRAILAAGNHTILRVAWVYGLRGKNFAKTILRLASECDELRIVNDQFGAPTSAEMIAEITACFIDRSLARGQKDTADQCGVFNVAPTGRISWHGFALELIREAERQQQELRLKEGRIIPIASNEYPAAAERPRNSSLDTGKLRRTFELDLPPWQANLKTFVANWRGSTT